MHDVRIRFWRDVQLRDDQGIHAGLCASTNMDAQVLASARETRPPNASPVAMPRSPRSGLRGAVMRANASEAAAAAAAKEQLEMSKLWALAVSLRKV